MAEPKTWSQIQREWGSKLAGLSPGDRDNFIRGILANGDDFAVYLLLIALKFRFDCPDIAFDLLDEINALKERQAPQPEFAVWGKHARSLLRQYIGDEPKSEELLRPPSSPRVN